MRRWWEGRLAARFEHDKAIVAEVQPRLRHEVGPYGAMTLVGDVVVKTVSGTPNRIPTRIDFPDDYPRNEPVAHEVGNLFPHDGDHHFSYSSDQCCLWLDAASPWSPRDPDALRMFLEQLAIFYHRQLMMKADPTLHFPGPWWGHGGEGYLQYLEQEWGLARPVLRRLALGFRGRLYGKAPCPCGSRRQYRRCHQPTIDRFRGRASKSSLEQLVVLLSPTLGRD